MALKEKEDLKRLQTLLEKQKSEISSIEKEKRLIDEKLSVAKKGLDRLNDELVKLQKEDTLILSEHAILRYIVRSMKLDLKAVEELILTDDLKLLHKKLGNGKYPIGNGLKAVIHNNVVVTVIG